MWRSGYLMCPKCGNVYYTNMVAPVPIGQALVYECPNYNCFGGELFTIDELMIPAIQKLNELGYKTRFCCSGHRRGIGKEFNELGQKFDECGRLITYGYIVFHQGYMPDKLPAGWEHDEDYKDTTIRSRDVSLVRSIDNLTEWAYHLKPFEKKNGSHI